MSTKAKILVVGLNHKSAPVEVRERLAFDTPKVCEALGRLREEFKKDEFVLLSTCNRVEVYCACGPNSGTNAELLIEFLSAFHDVALRDFRQCLYVHEDENAVRHLLMVASSLDSMVVGEDQIIGQVKESYRVACGAKTTGKVLNRLFHCSFATAKKVHTETAISVGRVSVAGVAVELAKQLFADISKARVTVIGAGETGELIVQHLLHEGCQDITILNRSFERGRDMARRYGVAAGAWEELGKYLREANVAIASAGCQHYLFGKAQLTEVLANRREGALLIIDIAVPRNFEPAINEMDDVYLYSVDELAEVAEQNRRVRESEITRGMQIVYDSAGNFMDWLRSREIGSLIGQMKKEFDQMSQKELERFFVGSRENAPCKDVAEAMVRRIVSKLSHCVIKNVDAVAKEHGPAEAARLVDSILEQARQISSETEEQRPNSN